MSQQSDKENKIIFFDWQELYDINIDDFEMQFGFSFQLPKTLIKKPKKFSKN